MNSLEIVRYSDLTAYEANGKIHIDEKKVTFVALVGYLIIWWMVVFFGFLGLIFLGWVKDPPIFLGLVIVTLFSFPIGVVNALLLSRSRRTLSQMEIDEYKRKYEEHKQVDTKKIGALKDLREAKKLLDEGVLEKKEFEKIKRMILGR